MIRQTQRGRSIHVSLSRPRERERRSARDAQESLFKRDRRRPACVVGRGCATNLAAKPVAISSHSAPPLVSLRSASISSGTTVGSVTARSPRARAESCMWRGNHTSSASETQSSNHSQHCIIYFDQILSRAIQHRGTPMLTGCGKIIAPHDSPHDPSRCHPSLQPRRLCNYTRKPRSFSRLHRWVGCIVFAGACNDGSPTSRLSPPSAAAGACRLPSTPPPQSQSQVAAEARGVTSSVCGVHSRCAGSWSQLGPLRLREGSSIRT